MDTNRPISRPFGRIHATRSRSPISSGHAYFAVLFHRAVRSSEPTRQSVCRPCPSFTLARQRGHTTHSPTPTRQAGLCLLRACVRVSLLHPTSACFCLIRVRLLLSDPPPRVPTRSTPMSNIAHTCDPRTRTRPVSAPGHAGEAWIKAQGSKILIHGADWVLAQYDNWSKSIGIINYKV